MAQRIRDLLENPMLGSTGLTPHEICLVTTALIISLTRNQIRVLDLVVLLKDEDEPCWRVEISDLPPEQAAVVEFIKGETIGLFDDEDVAWLCEGMEPVLM
jgi:hypothetical protein